MNNKKMNIRKIFTSSNQELKIFFFQKIKKEISDFNNRAKKSSSFFEPEIKSLYMRHKNIQFTFKRCKVEYYLLSKGIIVFCPKFLYDFGNDCYSAIEFFKYLIELQYNCNSLFPKSLDITAEELSVLKKYDKSFEEFLEDKTWFSYVHKLNNIINNFMEDNKDKKVITRKDVWEILGMLEKIPADKPFFSFLVRMMKKIKKKIL